MHRPRFFGPLGIQLVFASLLLKTRAGTGLPQRPTGPRGPGPEAQRHGWDIGSGRLFHYPVYCVPCVTDIYVLGGCGRKEMQYIIIIC